MASIRRHPNSPDRFQVRYRDDDGVQRSVNRESYEEALKFAATVTADVYRGDYIDPRLGKTKFAEFAELWTSTRGHLAQSTQDQDRHYLASLILPKFGDRPVASVSITTLPRFASTRLGGLTSFT